MTVQIDKGKVSGKLDLTPMIDIVFQLVLFFLVATELKENAERALDVKLPSATEAMPLVTRPKEMFINIDQQGRYFVAGEERSAEELFAALQQAWANNPGRQTVIIRADHRVPLQFAATVMDLCNRANIRDYRLATESPNGAPTGS